MSSPVGEADRAMRRNRQVPSHIVGADGEIRTRDLPLTRRLLCQLSYVGKLVGEIPLRRAPSRALRLASKTMRTLDVERLAAGDYDLIKPLLVELHLGEQVHYSDHPQLTRGEIERHLTEVPAAFRGENVIFAVRDEIGHVVGFCWIVLYDPGTGLEGEVAEVYVSAEHRGRGIGEMLVREAVRLFDERHVTLGYVWTRPDNESAVRLYRSVGFEPNRQLVMTWYPRELSPSN
jgi:ribosomal protein S18 acetylase RimI-like enzyme